MKRFSEFVPGISCDHEWMKGVLKGKRELCVSCGAECLRDDRGKIEEYTWPLGRKQGGDEEAS